MRAPGLLALGLLVGCAASPPELPLEPLWEPPAALPLRVGVRPGNSMASQLYSGAVIRELKQMRLFQELIHPFDASAQMEARLRLSVDRSTSAGRDEWVLVLADAGRPIGGAFASSEPIVTAHLPVEHVASGRLGTIEAAGASTLQAHARRMANALAREVWQERDALLARVREQQQQEPPP